MAVLYRISLKSKTLAGKLICTSGIDTIIYREFKRLHSKFIVVLRAKFKRKLAEVNAVNEFWTAIPDSWITYSTIWKRVKRLKILTAWVWILWKNFGNWNRLFYHRSVLGYELIRIHYFYFYFVFFLEERNKLRVVKVELDLKRPWSEIDYLPVFYLSCILNVFWF